MNNRLDRFLDAQNDIFEQVKFELTSGQKTGHWIWFIFPQIKGLGHSSLSEYYAIKNVEEAREYFDHRVLGERLTTCCELLLLHKNRNIDDILGTLDAIKLKSSMTLFESITNKDSVFSEILEKFYQSERDRKTIELLHSLQTQ